jgi:hypothetical protein
MNRSNRPPSSTPSKSRNCTIRGCGRPTFARGLCQTHERHLQKFGEIREIRPYRHRTPGTVKFAGLRLSPRCAKQLQRHAGRRGISLGAAIADVLEHTLVKPRRPRKKK